jgi:hypothetical protein
LFPSHIWNLFQKIPISKNRVEAITILFDVVRCQRFKSLTSLISQGYRLHESFRTAKL